MSEPTGTSRTVDVVVVGAGFAGLRALHTLRSRGYSVAVLEAADGVGGVWNWNRYPGARCDVESYDYSYSFDEDLQQEWRWSERYAAQPEILRYLQHVAERFDLLRDISLSTRVSSATWSEALSTWTVVTAETVFTVRYLVFATGQLSTTKIPDLPGGDSFGGEVYHTGQWPHTPVEFAGKRVGIIGTGSSGMQMTPVVARQVDHLTVFQRTANYSVPATNTPITDDEDAAVKATYAERRDKLRNSPTGLSVPLNGQSALEVDAAERTAHYEQNWPRLGFGFVLAYRDLLVDRAANDTAADFIRDKIAGLVDDPETREKLTPRGFPFGAKRPSVDSNYYPTFNRDNVTLVDIRTDPITEIVENGVRTRSGTTHELDMLVYATGFDVFTGSLFRIDIRGRGGVSLQDSWSAGPRTYLGLMAAGFPNMFVIAGPGSPSLLSNVIVSTEQHVDVIADLLVHADAEGVVEIEPDEQSVDDWVAHVNEKAAGTLYPQAVSYYNGDEIEGKPRVFIPYTGGVRGYRRIVERAVADDYKGFVMRRRSAVGS